MAGAIAACGYLSPDPADDFDRGASGFAVGGGGGDLVFAWFGIGRNLHGEIGRVVLTDDSLCIAHEGPSFRKGEGGGLPVFLCFQPELHDSARAHERVHGGEEVAVHSIEGGAGTTAFAEELKELLFGDLGRIEVDRDPFLKGIVPHEHGDMVDAVFAADRGFADGVSPHHETRAAVVPFFDEVGSEGLALGAGSPGGGQAENEQGGHAGEPEREGFDGHWRQPNRN